MPQLPVPQERYPRHKRRDDKPREIHLPSFGAGILELTDLRFCFWKTEKPSQYMVPINVQGPILGPRVMLKS